MTQFKDCRTTEFLFSLDNRLSDTAFISGTVANLATQVGTLIAYQQIGLTTLFNQHAMYKLYTNINNAFKTPDPNNAGETYINYQEVGRVLTNYMLSVVSYKAPNVNTGLKSK
jgi:hypothetical protein